MKIMDTIRILFGASSYNFDRSISILTKTPPAVPHPNHAHAASAYAAYGGE